MCFQYMIWYWATGLGEACRRPGGGSRTLNQRSKAVFEFPQSNVPDLQRQPQVRGDVASLVRQPRVGHLAQVQDRFVVAKEHRLELRIAVQAEALDDCAVEVAHQPVGQEKSPGPLVADLGEELLSRIHLIAVRSAQPQRTNLFEQRLEPSRGAAVAVDHDEVLITRTQVVELLAKLVDDPRWIEMEQRRHAVDVDVPLAPVDDVLHLAAERAADDQRGGAHVTCSSWGNPSTEWTVSYTSRRAS